MSVLEVQQPKLGQAGKGENGEKENFVIWCLQVVMDTKTHGLSLGTTATF
jgi:hypothetical protein